MPNLKARLQSARNAEVADTDFCAVMCAHDGGLYFAELQPGRTTEALVIEDISAGAFEDVQFVFKFNPVEGTARDVSEDVARAVLGKQLDDNGMIDLAVMDFLDDHLGCRAVSESVVDHFGSGGRTRMFRRRA